MIFQYTDLSPENEITHSWEIDGEDYWRCTVCNMEKRQSAISGRWESTIDISCDLSLRMAHIEWKDRELSIQNNNTHNWRIISHWTEDNKSMSLFLCNTCGMEKCEERYNGQLNLLVVCGEDLSCEENIIKGIIE
jgi:hypothetical protein